MQSTAKYKDYKGQRGFARAQLSRSVHELFLEVVVFPVKRRDKRLAFSDRIEPKKTVAITFPSLSSPSEELACNHGAMEVARELLKTAALEQSDSLLLVLAGWISRTKLLGGSARKSDRSCMPA